MRRSLLLFLWACLPVVGLSLGLPLEAHAVLTLQLDNVGSSGVEVTVVDQGPGDLNPMLGAVTFIGGPAGPLGPFNMNVTNVFSKPVVGSSTAAILDLSSTVIGSAGGIFQIRASDDFFTLPIGPQFQISRIGGVTQGIVTAQQYVNLNNVLFDTSDPGNITTGPQGPFGPGAFADTKEVEFAYPGGPFSITEIVTITHTSGGQSTSFNLESVVDVPEASTLIPLALGSGVSILLLWPRKSTRH